MVNLGFFCSLILKFWISLLRMPEILFDIRSNISVDVCLDVLAQNLIDSCLLNLNENGQPKLTKDSSTSKLLSARDIVNYQQMIAQYCKDISMLPSIKEGDIIAYMKDVSKVIFTIGRVMIFLNYYYYFLTLDI